MATSPRCCGDSTLNNYGERISGYFIPPVNGNYTFFMVHDDEGAIRFGTAPETATNALDRVCCDNPSFSNLSSVVIQGLTAGQPYYIEGLLKEGAGGDGLDIAVLEPTNTLPSYLLGPIPGGLPGHLRGFLEHHPPNYEPAGQHEYSGSPDGYAARGASVQPTNLFGQLLYQWQGYNAGLADFTNIAGAVSAAYTTPPLVPQVGGYAYRVIVQARASSDQRCGHGDCHG